LFHLFGYLIFFTGQHTCRSTLLYTVKIEKVISLARSARVVPPFYGSK
jgi:hypothetical protein